MLVARLFAVVDIGYDDPSFDDVKSFIERCKWPASEMMVTKDATTGEPLGIKILFPTKEIFNTFADTIGINRYL